MFFDTTIGKLVVWQGAAWREATSIATPEETGILAWGVNSSGRLGIGDGSVTSKRSPVSIAGGITDWIQVSSSRAFGRHTLAISAGNFGKLFAWGVNGNGQLGDGTTTGRISPVSLTGLASNSGWRDISAGAYHSGAIYGTGTLLCWGSNSRGELGDNTTTGRSLAVSVVGGFTDWKQVSCGLNHTMGLRANGTLWGWGYNALGQLGNNTTTNRSSPVSVVGGFTDWVQVSAARLHTLAIRANGQLWSWGNNDYYGTLGDGTVSNRSSPVSVVGGFIDWVQVSGSTSHNAGLRSNGQIWSWGGNSSGQLGDGTTTKRSSPVSLVGGITDWVQVSTGGRAFTSAIRANGTAWAWGYNSSGQLGDDTTTNRSSPVSITGGSTNWVQMAAGGDHCSGLRAAPRKLVTFRTK